MIDFAAGTSASVLHWTINNYDSLAITRGDLSLSSTTKTSGEQEVEYEPPPPDTVIIANNRVPWIRPPAVSRVEPSHPGAPPHE